MRTTLIMAVLPMLSLITCGSETTTSSEAEPTLIPAAEAPQKPQTTMTSSSTGDGIFAHFQTRLGKITIRLEHEKAPMTVANFVGLAEGTVTNTFRKQGEPYFDGIIFHRVIPGFMIQCGDPTGTGMGGPGYAFADEFDPSLRHDGPGVLSMANSGPGTNGSQFFITVAPTPHLDGRHAVFGRVVEGMEVATAIANVPRGAQDRPNQEVKIDSLRIERRGENAMKFDVAAVLKANASKFGAR